MKLKKLLSEYVTLKQKLVQLKDKHGISAFEEEVAQAEIDLKNLAKESTPEDVLKAKTEDFFIRVDQPYKRYYDLKLIKKHASKDELSILEEKAFVVDVDRNRFDKLVVDGKISRELKAKAFKEKKLSMRAAIVPIKHD